MKQISWFGCYADSWQGEIVPEAFSHPAKFSRGLIARIYDHMLASGYISPGDTVGDPFGGVALGAIHAMLKGLHWRGCELEPKFVELGGQNIDLWQAKYGDLLTGTAVLVQGDSREFVRHIAAAGGVVSSAPYADSINQKGNGIDTDKFKGADRQRDFGRGNSNVSNDSHYGSTPGQLGAMKEGDLNTVVSSPAYADVINGSGEGPGARFDHVHHSGDNATKKSSTAEYGRTAGNLGNLSAVVIGNDTGNTFWQAAAVIVAQAYEALKPGGYAAWVCGDYVRNGERVYFGRQWLELCEAVGFTGVEWITAWKREPGPVQAGLFGDDKDLSIDRVSFFRRLANEKNPDAAILNEDVIIVRK